MFCPQRSQRFATESDCEGTKLGIRLKQGVGFICRHSRSKCGSVMSTIPYENYAALVGLKHICCSKTTHDSVQIASLCCLYFENLESLKKICMNFQTSDAACCDVPTFKVPCEKPTPTGWSMYKTFASLFQEYGFNVTEVLSLVIRHGPFSCNSPIMLELPG